jgi:hypothetical protein
VLEQIRVQKLLDCLKSHESKESETDILQEKPKTVLEKFVQTEKLESTYCNCSLILAPKIEEINQKLDLLLTRETRYTLLTSPSTSKFEFNNQDCEYAGSLSPSSDLDAEGADAVQEQDLGQQQHIDGNDEAVSMVSMIDTFDLPGICHSTPSPPPPPPPPPPPSLVTTNFRPALFEEIYKESSSMCNYAKNLVFKLFHNQELQGSNCSGMKGKKSLEVDQRMEIIKEATFKKYPVEDRKRSWSMCRKAIDSAIRHCKQFK